MYVFAQITLTVTYRNENSESKLTKAPSTEAFPLINELCGDKDLRNQKQYVSIGLHNPTFFKM